MIGKGMKTTGAPAPLYFYRLCEQPASNGRINRTEWDGMGVILCGFGSLHCYLEKFCFFDETFATKERKEHIDKSLRRLSSL